MLMTILCLKRTRKTRVRFFIPYTSLVKKGKEGLSLHFVDRETETSKDCGTCPWSNGTQLIPGRAVRALSGLPSDPAGKESACNAGDLGSIPGLGRSLGEENGYPLQSSGLENPMDCIVHEITKSRTRLSDFNFQSS